MDPQRTDEPARTTWRPEPFTYLVITGVVALAGAIAIVALAAMFVGALAEDPLEDREAFCASASAVERAVQRPEVADPEAFPGQEREHALEQLDEALDGLRQEAPPSLRADVDRYTNAFPLLDAGLGVAPRESGQRIAELVEAECGFAFDHVPGPARRR